MDSDEALYARVKHGDMRAFDELYARHARRLFGFLRAQLPTPADAEDVMHEAILATLESREVAFDRGSFRTWLYRIARNRVLNRARSQGRGQGAIARMNVEQEPPPAADERIERDELLVALDGAV
jgi:RNA polymerase sigma-70 factor (ECF subfamily)